MTKRKNTKRALILSALSLLLCVSMLVGSTFAWFTDNATTSVNTIQSGKLDIQLLAAKDKDAASLEGETLTFAKAEGHEDEAVLWEPGAKYKLTDAWLYNAGNLHVKYQVVISGIDGDSKLAEVLDVFVDGENCGTLKDLATTGKGIVKSDKTLAPGDFATFGSIELMMQTTAGNEYQNLTLAGIAITVNATQATVEYDSEDNQYDDGAQYDELVTVSAKNATETINNAIANSVKTGTPVVLTFTENAAIDEIITVPEGANVTFNLNGKTLTIADSSVDPMIDTKVGSSVIITGNGTIDLGNNYTASIAIPRDNFTIENGTFVKNYAENTSYGSLFAGASSAVGTFAIKGGYFDGGYYKEGDCFNNCRNLLNKAWSTQSIQVTGGTFVGQNPAWGDEGMAVVCPHCEKPTIKEDGTEDYGYCQGVFLVGQDWKSASVPAGYTFVEGTTDDGRPTYTVNYNP